MSTKLNYSGLLSGVPQEDEALTRLCHRLKVDPSLPDAQKYELIGRKLAPKEKEYQKRGRPRSNYFAMSDDELLSMAVDQIKDLGLATTDKDALELLKSVLTKEPQDELLQRMWRPTIDTRLKKVSQGRKIRKRKEKYETDAGRLDFGLRKKT